MTQDISKITNKVDLFIGQCEKNVEDYPYIIVMLMHDFIRNLYPDDPHIPFNTKIS